MGIQINTILTSSHAYAASQALQYISSSKLITAVQSCRLSWKIKCIRTQTADFENSYETET
jgi:hypothetical protein